MHVEKYNNYQTGDRASPIKMRSRNTKSSREKHEKIHKMKINGLDRRS